MAAKKPSTALATPKVALPTNYDEVQQADISAFKNRLAVTESNKISVTQQGDFKVPVPGDDPIKSKTISGIIVDFASRKAFYSSGFDRDNPIPPDCFAIGFVAHDNLLSDEDSPNRQNETCKGCSRNVWEKDAQGKWIPPECKSSYRLALLAPDDDGSGRLMTLDLSSTAIKEHDKYVRALSNKQLAPYNVVTEFFFDPNSEYPSVRSRDIAEVPRTALGFVLSTRDDALGIVTRKPNLDGFEEKKAAASKRKLPAPKKPLKKAA
jgi:hypothetical protein